MSVLQRAAHFPTREPTRFAPAEIALVLTLGLLALLAWSVYRSGDLALALLLVGLPLGVLCLIQPRIGIYAYGFWQAWDSAVKFGGGSEQGWLTVAKLLALVVVATSFFHIILSPRRLARSRGCFICLFGLSTAATLSVGWSYEPGGSLRLAAQMWVQLALAWAMVRLVGSDRAAAMRLMFWTILGALSAGLYVLAFGMEQRAYLRATLGESANPVSVAAALATGLACIPLLWALTASRAIRVLLIPTGLAIFCAIFATGTRAAVAAVSFGLLSTGILSRSIRIGGRITLLMASLVLMLGGTFVALNMGTLSEQAADRLRHMLMLETESWDPDANVPQASRTEIWWMSLQSYAATYGIGTGLGASAAANERLSGYYKDVHSSIVGSLTELGLPGFAAFAGLHVALFLGIRRLRAHGLQSAALVMFFTFLLLGSTHTLYTTKWFWLPVAFLLAVFELDAHEAAPAAGSRSWFGARAPRRPGCDR